MTTAINHLSVQLTECFSLYNILSILALIGRFFDWAIRVFLRRLCLRFNFIRKFSLFCNDLIFKARPPRLAYDHELGSNDGSHGGRGILSVESLPSRTSGSNDWVERSILKKTERADSAVVAYPAFVAVVTSAE